MKQKKIVGVLMVCLLCCTALVGCNMTNRDSSDSDDIIYYKLSIDGERIPLTEDDEDAKKIEEVSKGYTNALTRADYTDAFNDEEYTYYTKASQEYYKEIGELEEIAEYIKSNHLLTKIKDTTLKSEELYTVDGELRGKSVVEVITVTEQATDEYIKENEIEKGVEYKRTATLELIQEEGEWKVLELIYLTAREKVE